MAAMCNQNGTVNKRILTLKECVEEYGVSLWFWRRMLWDGALPFIRVGRKQLLDRRDIEKFLESRKVINGS
jgi:excisionase family DNA binding protein